MQHTDRDRRRLLGSVASLGIPIALAGYLAAFMAAVPSKASADALLSSVEADAVALQAAAIHQRELSLSGFPVRVELEVDAAVLAAAESAWSERSEVRTEYARERIRGRAANPPRYQELGSGLSYRDENGQWQDSDTAPAVQHDRTVRYEQLPVQRTFAPWSGQRIVVTSQRRGSPPAHSALGGLSYYDPASGRSALIAWVTNAPVQVHDQGVYYPSAFLGVDADLVYKVHPWGLEQDVVLYGGLPDPAVFGMDPASTRLCALTELVDLNLDDASVQREKNARPADPAAASLELDVRHANAWTRLYNWQPSYAYPEDGTLTVGGADKAATKEPVAMRLVQAAGRVFLSEEVPFAHVVKSAPQLIADKAPEAPVVAIGTPLALPPERTEGQKLSQGREGLGEERKPDPTTAGFAPYFRGSPSPRYVLDYVDWSGAIGSNLTIQSGQTYYISAPLTLSSGARLTIERGSYIKFGTNGSISLSGGAWVESRADAFSPALFTYVGDTNSAGETIGTNVHLNGRYPVALSLGSGTNQLRGLHIRHAQKGIVVDYNTDKQLLRDLVFSNCTRAVEFGSSLMTGLVQNVLIVESTQGVVSAASATDVRNATFAGVQEALSITGTTLAVRDSLFASVGNAYASNSVLASGTFQSNGTFQATNGWVGATPVTLGASPFASGTYGMHYLIQTTALINAGSRNAANAGLYPFTTASSGIIESNTWVDIGYHYPTASDTDEDGLPDIVEDANGDGTFSGYFSDVADWTDTDTDDDGLDDAEEYWTYRTNPQASDTDGDGQSDHVEVINGSDPLDSNSVLRSLSGAVTYGGAQTGNVYVVVQSYAVVTSPAALNMAFDDAATPLADNSAWQTVCSGNATWQSNNGLRGGGYFFDGDDSIRLGDLSQVEGTYGLSYGGWVRVDSGIWLGGVIGKTVSEDESMMLFLPEGTIAQTYIRPESKVDQWYVERPAVVTNGVWQHVMGVYGGTSLTLYINGEVAGTTNLYVLETVRSNDVIAALGDTAYGRHWYFKGRMDEVGVYRRALSAPEVKGLYLDGMGLGSKRQVTNASLGAYVATNVPSGSNYWVWAWRDHNGNGKRDYFEPFGVHLLNPRLLTNSLTGVDIPLGDPDSDGDGVGDYTELQAGTSPTDPNYFPCTLAGRLAYSGGQTGVIRVTAVATQSYQTAISSTNVPYELPNVPNQRSYTLTAYRDSNGNGTQDVIEANGSYTGNPLLLTVSVTNIDLTLADPDRDQDGMPDWWEIQYGFNPTSPIPGQGEGWWKFDETGGTNAANSAGTNYNGQLVAMGTNVWVTGLLGGALQFDGSDDYVRVPQSPAIITGQQFTASAWAWLDGDFAQEAPSVISDMVLCGGNYRGFWVGYDTYWPGLAQIVGGCSYYLYSGANGAITGRWAHIAITYDGSTNRLYLDGHQVAYAQAFMGTHPFSPATQSEVRIGWANDPNYTYHWKGLLDDVRLYRTALSSNAVARMYEGLADYDGDGLCNRQEYDAHTSPELNDTDEDGLSDYQEVYQFGSDPAKSDTDSDGMTDGWEVAEEFLPTDADDAAEDADADGLSNLTEFNLGTAAHQADDVVPVRPSMYEVQTRESRAYRMKCGYQEFTQSAWPPEYYLQKDVLMNGWQERRDDTFNPCCGVGAYQFQANYVAQLRFSVDRDTQEEMLRSGSGSSESNSEVDWDEGPPWWDTCQSHMNADGTWSGVANGFGMNYPMCPESCPFEVHLPCFAVFFSGDEPQEVSPTRWRISDSASDPAGSYFKEAIWTLSVPYTTDALLNDAKNDIAACAPATLDWGRVAMHTSSGCVDSENVGGSAMRDLSENQVYCELKEIEYRVRALTENNVIYEINTAERVEDGYGVRFDNKRSWQFVGTGGDVFTAAAGIPPPANNGSITPVVIAILVSGPNSLCVGRSETFEATGGSEPYSWISSNPQVASVDQAGNVEGVTPGLVVITATDAEGFKGRLVVEVGYMDLGPPRFLPIGGQVTITPRGGTSPFSWQSTLPAVATVNANGVVTAVSLGDAVISATDGAYCSGIVTVSVLKVEMITPAGDPVNAAVQSGDGQNEFTYSPASPGVLTMNLKAKVTPSGIANQIKDQCLFTVDAIAGSTLAWDAANPGGKPTASGDNLLATVTFTGLPANNASFGSKKAAVNFNACKQDEESYEVFYPKVEKNHPSDSSNADWPNWMFYWLQSVTPLGSPSPTFTYGTSSGFTPGTTQIGLSDGDAGAYPAPYVTPTLYGIDNFAWTVIHESQHYKDWCDLWSNNYTDWWNNHKGNSGPGDDKDGDRIPNSTEDVNLNGTYDSGDLYDWQNYNTPTPGRPGSIVNDFEDWNCQRHTDARGDHSKDWGDPGMQHKTKDKYDD